MAREVAPARREQVLEHLEAQIGSHAFLEVVGMDFAYVMDAQEKIETFADMTDKEAVEQILGNYADLTPMAEDLLGSEKGFLVFERYEDGEIRAFRLRARDVDNYLFGSLFIRKRQGIASSTEDSGN